jgi:hypothetical protein
VPQGVNDGGQRGHNARVVGDGRAVFGERDVEIDADEEPLVGQFDVANGELGHGVNLSTLNSEHGEEVKKSKSEEVKE